jgi:predicted outer membrane protein
MAMKASRQLTRNCLWAALAASLTIPLLLAGCDRRKVEDDTARTPSDQVQSGETVNPPAATPGTTANPAVDQTATPAPQATAPAGTPAAGATSQADALAMLMAVDEHEIAAADQAMGKNVTGKVRDFAQMMKTDHGKNLADTTKLGGAMSTAPAVDALKKKGENDLHALGAQSGVAYEKAYIDAMVQGHTEALAMIDNTLLPAATDANIRQHFTTTRAAVARHLDRAKEIQASLK